MNIEHRILYVLSLLTLLHTGVTNAESAITQNDLRKKIEMAAAAEIESSKTPSLQISVGKGEQIIFEGAYGLADIENDVNASPASKYRTASVAKWFTATAAMQLSANGSLDLDTSIQKYCPEFPAKETPITARQLLTHTAGIRGYFDYEKALSETKDRAEIENLQMRKLQEEASFYTRYTDVLKPLDTFKDDPAIFTPGTDWEYTSFGYRVLACVMQGAAKMDYRRLMQDLVFTPANMQNTEVDDAWKIISGRVSGYHIDRGEPLRRANMRDVSENLPAGGYLSTSSDLVRFALAFNRSLVPNSVKAQMTLPARSIKMDTDTAKSWRDAMPSADKYGYGVMLFSKYEDGMIGHTGRQDGGSAILILSPKSGLAIAIMTNAKGWNGYLDFAIKIKDIVEKSDQ
jgi:serine beta-lactamase-like protein LACTB, mitochondrial